MHSSELIEIAITAFAMLAAGNLWFVRRLVIKIDKIDDIERAIGLHHGTTNEKIKGLEEKMSDFSARVQDLSGLKSEVAILKYVIGGALKHNNQTVNVPS